MDPHYLVTMANEIAAFFAGEEPGKAAENVANHLRRYWDPRMRKQILEHTSTAAKVCLRSPGPASS